MKTKWMAGAAVALLFAAGAAQAADDAMVAGHAGTKDVKKPDLGNAGDAQANFGFGNNLTGSGDNRDLRRAMSDRKFDGMTTIGHIDGADDLTGSGGHRLDPLHASLSEALGNTADGHINTEQIQGRSLSD